MRVTGPGSGLPSCKMCLGFVGNGRPDPAVVSGFRSDTGEVRTSTNNYDVNGHLVGITDDTGVDTAHRQFVNDANGIVLQKTQQANVADSPIPAFPQRREGAGN